METDFCIEDLNNLPDKSLTKILDILEESEKIIEGIKYLPSVKLSKGEDKFKDFEKYLEEEIEPIVIPKKENNYESIKLKELEKYLAEEIEPIVIPKIKEKEIKFKDLLKIKQDNDDLFRDKILEIYKKYNYGDTMCYTGSSTWLYKIAITADNKLIEYYKSNILNINSELFYNFIKAKNDFYNFCYKYTKNNKKMRDLFNSYNGILTIDIIKDYLGDYFGDYNSFKEDNNFFLIENNNKPIIEELYILQKKEYDDYIYASKIILQNAKFIYTELMKHSKYGRYKYLLSRYTHIFSNRFKCNSIEFDIYCYLQLYMITNKVLSFCQSFTLPIRNVKKLIADFIVLINIDNNIHVAMIEYDGVQHYNTKNFMFNKTNVRRDILKNNYCISRGFSVLRLNGTKNILQRINTFILTIIKTKKQVISIPPYEEYLKLLQ